MNLTDVQSSLRMGLAASLFTLAAASHASVIPGAWAGVGVGGVNGGSQVTNGGSQFHSAAISRSSPLGNSGEAFSSLSDGSLKAKVFTPVQTDPRCVKLWVGCTPGLTASATAHFRDSITFSAKDLKHPGEVKFRFAISGSEGANGGSKYAPYSRSMFSFDFASLEGTSKNYRQVHDGDIFAGSLMVPAGAESITLDLFATLFVEAMNGGWADYSHTARFEWEVPEGIEYWSASGTFMSDHPLPPPPAQVPEPTPLALAGVGLIAMAFNRRRSKQALS